MTKQTDIDFVITWVDGNDPAWLKEKAQFKIQTGDVRTNRYRDWNFLPYWFRSVEKNAPWVHRIFFVTWGHLPEWLNLSHPKLQVVTHKEFIPERYLPTFSCRPIELNMHRIPGLSEQFVYFNDDMFLLDEVRQTDFFINGLPCDTAVLDASSINETDNDKQRIAPEALYSTLIFNVAAINRNFNKKEVIKKNRGKWYSLKYGKEMIRTLLLSPWSKFTGFRSPHIPYSYLKTTFSEVWAKEEEVLERACIHKFREPTDVSSRLFSYWQLAEGRFAPRSPKAGISTSICSDRKKNDEIIRVIREKERKMICINDDYRGEDFEKVREQFIQAFESIFPEKSAFEKY